MLINATEYNGVACASDEMGLPISLSKASEILRILQSYIADNTEETIQEKLEVDLLDRFPDMYERVTGKKLFVDPGYVYLMHGEGTNWYKVGKTNSVPTRKNTLRILLPFDVEVVSFYCTNQVSKVEDMWKKRFSDKRSNGEWYTLNESDVTEFVSVASKGVS